MSIQKVFPYLLLILGALYIAVVPPLESPDEPAHVKRAYLLGHGQLLVDTPPGLASGGLIDDGLAEYLLVRRAELENPDAESTRAQIARLGEIEWTGTRSFGSLPNTGYNFPLAYAPQALGLRIGELLSLRVETWYYLARSCVLAFSVAALALAIMLAPASPLVIILLLLPMSLFQFASASLDGVATALSVLVVSLFLRGADTRQPLSTPMLLALSACLLVVATARLHLLPLVLLPLYLCFARRSLPCLGVFLVVAPLSVGWVSYVGSTIMDPGLDAVRKATQPEVIAYYLARPLDFARVLANTPLVPHQMGNCLVSFVGVLGWLDVWLASWFYKLSYFALGLVAICSILPPPNGRDWYLRLSLLALSSLSILFVLAALLANWTPHPATAVNGLQGRYFIVPALLCAYALSGPEYPGRHRQRELWGSWIVFVWMLLAAFAALQALLVRYHPQFF